jgi:hypothetical protein
MTKNIVLVLGALITFGAFSNEIRVYDSTENTNELTIIAHRNEVVFFQTSMPELVTAKITQGDFCAVEMPLRRLVGVRQVTTEARIVPYTMGNPVGRVCSVTFSDGTYETHIRILYR